jgi:hypothetical protein
LIQADSAIIRAEAIDSGYSLVFIPQARSPHHPRIASNSAKAPKASNRIPPKSENLKPKPAATKRATANTPRASLPVLLMFRRKNCFIVLVCEMFHTKLLHIVVEWSPNLINEHLCFPLFGSGTIRGSQTILPCSSR